MRPRQPKLIRLVTLGLAVLPAACNRGIDAPADTRDKAAGETVGLEAPRAEIVARADQLAMIAEKASPSSKAPFFIQAAELRERIWRLERHKADALEAIELYSDAGRDGDCAAYARGVALRAELEIDPGTANAAMSAGGKSEQAGGVRQPPGACDLPLLALRKVLGVAVAANASSGGSPLGTAPQGGESTVPGRDAQAEGGGSLVSPPPSFARQVSEPRIDRIERYGSKDSARIVVRLSEPATYRAGLLRSEDASTAARLYVDIDRATIDKPVPYAVGGLVQGVRVARQTDGVRLVLDLEEPAERHIFYVPEPFRLVIDVARGAPVGQVAKRAPRIVERVVIDPGHGGNDPGAIGPRGLREKDVTLDIAHRAAPLIARELGLSTLLTRDTDTYVALDERTARANAFRADLFISIHCNAAEKTGSDGVYTFVLDTTGDLAAARVAAIENAASANASKELANALGPVQDEGVLARSYHFAELLQKSSVASLSRDYGKIPNQGVRRAGFYVLAGAHMPAALYEVSFISNPEGEIRLNTADYRQRLADSIVNAVRAYRDGL